MIMIPSKHLFDLLLQIVLSDALELAAALKGCGSDYTCNKGDKKEIRTKCLLSLNEWKLIVGSYEPSWLMVSCSWVLIVYYTICRKY